jgi:hypothetical protein
MHRFYRLAATGVFTTLCAMSTAQAQTEKLFQDSWFWGVHAGVTTFGTPATSNQSAGSFGAEWMITRSVGGLYLSFDQANFNSTGAIADGSETSGIRPVSLHDMRTGSIGAMAFPVRFGNFRPYAGAGFSLSVIGTATARPDIGETSASIDQSVVQNVDNAKSRSAVFLMGGGQWQVNRTAVYGQIMVTPGDDNFLINGAVTQISVGVRYNFGSSIER